MADNRRLTILVAEDELDLLELYSLLIGTEFDANFLEAENGQVAIKHINENPGIDLIISDFNMPKANGLDVYLASKQNGRQIPFVLVTSDHLHDHTEFMNMPATGYVQKPFSEVGLYSEIRRVLAGQVPTQIKTPQYVPISISTLKKIKDISKPLYVRLAEDNFVKIVNENTLFDEVQEERFKQKGIKQLFVGKEDLNFLIHDFKTSILNEMLFKGVAGRKSEAIKLSASVQEIVAGTVRTFGITEETARLAEKNIQMVGAVLEATPELATVFELLNDTEGDYGIIHSVILSYLLTALAKEVKIPHQHGIEILSMAAFFHDLILDDNQVRNEAKFINGLMMGSSLNKADLSVVSDHMNRVVESLAEWKTAPVELSTVISQHHELPDGSGFPEHITAEKIHDLSAIFIVAHDLAEIYLRSKNRDIVVAEFNKRAPHYSHPKFQPYFEGLLRAIANK